MADSPIHIILNDIRKSYSNKKCSMIDIRNIENKYRICSVVNTRANNCAFLRITSYGLKEVLFEDVCLDYSQINADTSDIHRFIYTISKGLYEMAYGVFLEDVNDRLIDEDVEPSIDFFSLEDELSRVNTELERVKQECSELKQQLSDLQNNKQSQISIFDS